MKKSRTTALIGMVFAAAFFISSSAQAGGAAPGEGYYVGAFLGHGTGIVQAEVTSFPTNNGAGRRGTFESDRGGLGLSGIQGGLWAGWGMRTADDLYFGAEISGAGSDEKIELTSSVGLQDNDGESITSATAQRKWQAGGALRVGYYVNSETLLALSGGVAVSQFDVDIGSKNETYYAGGPQVGASITTQLSKIDPNLGLRMEFVYTNYLTAEINGMDNLGQNTGNDSEVTGHDTAGRIGVTYRF